jgi:hypothetical protein
MESGVVLKLIFETIPRTNHRYGKSSIPKFGPRSTPFLRLKLSFETLTFISTPFTVRPLRMQNRYVPNFSAFIFTCVNYPFHILGSYVVAESGVVKILFNWR